MDDIIANQRRIDGKFGWDWRNLSPQEQLEKLQYCVMALTGELGEIANPLKKVVRDAERFGVKDEAVAKLRAELREEIVDVFIYTLKMADILGVELKEAYFEKAKKNEEKHARFQLDAQK